MSVKTTFDKELCKIFGDDLVLDNTKYIGRSCYGELDGNIRMKATFASMELSSHYDAIKLQLLNRTEGEIDTVVIRFNEIWGKKAVSNPHFQNGVFPHLWLSDNKLEWYVYQPTPRDIEILRDSIQEYVSVFKDFSMEHEQKPSIKQQLSDSNSKPTQKKPAKDKNNDLEV